jgi:hypothetical protein
VHQKSDLADPVVIVIGDNISGRTWQLVAQLQAAATPVYITADEYRAAEEHALLVADRIRAARSLSPEEQEHALHVADIVKANRAAGGKDRKRAAAAEQVISQRLYSWKG